MTRLVLTVLGLLVFSTSNAQIEVPNTFEAGEPARAAEVNANFDALESAVNENAAEIEGNTQSIQANAASIEALDLDTINTEVQLATVWGRRGRSSGLSSLEVLEKLVLTLGLTCAEANYGRFLGCTQLTAGDGTIWPIANMFTESAVALIHVDDFARTPDMLIPYVGVVQTNNRNEEMLVGGTANFLRWTYADPDDVARLVDDCNNPTVAMSPPWEAGTSSRWRVNNGGYYYTRVEGGNGQPEPTGQIDVTGQTVGIVKNIDPLSTVDAGSVVWCEMSNQVSGIYNTYELQPYPFNLNEARFSNPFTVD